MKRITTRFIQASLCLALLSTLYIQHQTEAQTVVGHPCEIKPNIDSSNTGIGHHRYVVDVNGINQGDYAVDLNSNHCANNRIIAPISGRISFSRGQRFYNRPGRLSCIVDGRYVGVPDENGEIRNTIIRIDGDDGVSVKLLHGHRGNFREGQRVNVGDVIGTIGSIGCSTGPHIHIEVRQHGNVLLHRQWDFGYPAPSIPQPEGDALQLTSFIRGADGREMCVDVSGNNRFNGSNIQLWECNNGNAQKFYYEPSTGFVRLYDDPDWCLDVDHQNFRNGTNIHLWECNNTDAQRFNYNRYTGQLRVRASQRYCLDVDGARNDWGTNIKIWECRGNNPAQQFRIPQLVQIRAQSIRGIHRQPMCVDVSGAHFQNETNVHLWSCNRSNAQTFLYENRTGNIRVKDAPNMCLDVRDGNLNPGPNIQLYGCNRSPAQNFSHDVRYNYIRLGERRDVCMDISDYGNTEGTNIHTWTCSHNDAQRFILEQP